MRTVVQEVGEGEDRECRGKPGRDVAARAVLPSCDRGRAERGGGQCERRDEVREAVRPVEIDERVDPLGVENDCEVDDRLRKPHADDRHERRSKPGAAHSARSLPMVEG